MNDIRLGKYLNEHALIVIGRASKGVLCADAILDNWDSFLDFVFEYDIYITQISWWERCLIGQQNVLGGGGPVDKTDRKYYWSELYTPDFTIDISIEMSKRQLKEYIKRTIEKYATQHELWPAFTLKNSSGD